ncbi:Uu.00g022850.m01.CDS01 [Anthostomella pinea]|uniref:Uu.00g022850.m01.CDS01 n=1 Tax=Anthostomella pinea TaxID=933095 RepID=A0AAI8YR27_9PEZI|nr:Uu.00g022850.m01.CDS01 [Anthostomella pinea]
MYEDSLSDAESLAKSISGTRAVFIAVRCPGNMPGSTIAQNTAAALIAALRILQTTFPNRKLPQVVLLSTASTSDYHCRDLSPTPRTHTLVRIMRERKCEPAASI